MGNNTLLAGTAPEGTSNLHWHHGAGVLMLGIGWLVIERDSLLTLPRRPSVAINIEAWQNAE